MRFGWLLLLIMLGLAAAPASGQNNVTQEGAATAQPASGSYDPLLDLPPLPQGKTTLVGGTVHSIDQIRNRLTVQPFGGKAMKISFDERTHIYRDGAPSTQLVIHKGDRVYVDTMLDGTRVFARNIRVVTGTQAADARGQITSNNAATGRITVQDELSARPVTFRVTPTTAVSGAGLSSVAQLQPGSLVTVKFVPDRSNRDVAQQISVIAAPGSVFTFYGRITYLNMSTRSLAVDNQSDKKTYDIKFTPAAVDPQMLGEGKQVLVKAHFDGSGYTADNIQFMKATSQ
ncbi:MAG TPA: DUF5666 domain-containing protein [Terriglobales bacterium]|nr:DUF5666 domain-containing protein [Terriglobales bacterium]